VQHVQGENTNAKLDKVKRFCIAYEFMQDNKVRDDAISGVEQMKSNILELNNFMEQIQLEIDDKEKEKLDLSIEKENKLVGDMKISYLKR
jgi:structural maintenance of chromosome 2